MKIMKKLLLFILLLFFVLNVAAIPARRQPREVKQSDGTTLVVRLIGNEAFHYYTTLDNVPVVRGANGDFFYATLSADGFLESSGVLAHNAMGRSYEEQSVIDMNDFSNLRADVKKIALSRINKNLLSRRKSQTIRPNGVINVPVLLVEFADEKFTFTKQDIEPIFNGVDYTDFKTPYLEAMGIGAIQGSVRDYFSDQSDGAFTPNFIVTDIITLDKNMSYYGGNNNEGNDKNPQQMIIDACRKVDGKFDFSKCDNNGDGEIEFLYCMYAGYSEASGASENTVWPHQWYLSSHLGTITLDGVIVDNYACSSELAFSDELAESYGSSYANNISGIGSCCHEFSHCLGLPDFYDTSDSDNPNFGMDYWDLMDYGCYNVEGYIPIGYSAYERDFMGWRELMVLTEKGDYQMTALTAGGHGYKIINEANENEYYILENRQQEGWDSYIFNSGMLITHVDYSYNAWFNNVVNNNASHQRFTIIPADGKQTTYDSAKSSDEYTNGLRGDIWPGNTGNTELTDTSSPAAKVYSGSYMSKPITNIVNKNKVVSFSFMRGPITAPEALAATDISAEGFTANWTAVEDAVKYTLRLEKIVKDADNTVATVLLADDFIKCTKGNLAINSPDEFMSMPGWSVNNVYAEIGVLRIGSSANKGLAETPVFKKTGNITLSYKVKLHNNNDKNSVLTLFLKNNETNELTELQRVVASSSWKTNSVSFTTDDRFSIVFSTEHSTGNKRVWIDDLEINLESNETVEHIQSVETDKTDYTFSGLESGMEYRYSVTATDAADKTSALSNYIYVTLLTTGIDNMDAVETVEVYSINGNKLYVGAEDNIPVLASGVYIYRYEDRVEKVFVK